MNVDLSVERTLVVDNILHVWNVKTSCSHISADKNRAIGDLVNHGWSGLFCWISKLDWLVFNLLDSSLEPIEVLQTLFLLHFAVKRIVLDFQKIEYA